MLVIVGLIVWLVAGIVAIAGGLSNAGAAHPLTENLRVRLSPHGVDRHVVPLWDLGQRGGAAGTEGALGRRAAPASRGPDAQPPASNVTWRSSTEPATPGSNTNSEPTAPRSNRRPDEGATRRRRNPLPGRWSRDRQSMNSGRVEEARSRGL